MDEIDKYRNEFCERFPEQVDVQLQEACEHEPRIAEGYTVCIICGTVLNYQYVGNRPVPISYHIYRRRTYFQEKLKLISGVKQSSSSSYNDVVQLLSKEEFNTIFELKSLLRKKKLSKFYKYIYSIYFDIKKEKLINLNYSQINFLSGHFQLIERQFKKLRQFKSFSYNTVLFHLLRHYDFDEHIHIILPKNYKKKCIEMIELLKFIER